MNLWPHHGFDLVFYKGTHCFCCAWGILNTYMSESHSRPLQATFPYHPSIFRYSHLLVIRYNRAGYVNPEISWSLPISSLFLPITIILLSIPLRFSFNWCLSLTVWRHYVLFLIHIEIQGHITQYDILQKVARAGKY